MGKGCEKIRVMYFNDFSQDKRIDFLKKDKVEYFGLRTKKITYLKTFKINDYVDVKVDKNLLYKFYHEYITNS